MSNLDTEAYAGEGQEEGRAKNSSMKPGFRPGMPVNMALLQSTPVCLIAHVSIAGPVGLFEPEEAGLLRHCRA